MPRTSAPVALIMLAGTCSCSDPAPEADGGTNTTAMMVTSAAATSDTSSAGPSSTTSASATSGAAAVTSGSVTSVTATSGSVATVTNGTGGSTASSSSAGDATATNAATTSSGGSDTTGTTTETVSTTGGTIADNVCPFTPTATPEGSNWVNGELVQFNDNGGWCWYQDERVIVDQEAGKIILSSVASGGSRDTDVEVVHWDLATEQGERHTLGSMGYADDHDVAALAKRPDGGYVAMWAGHNDDCKSYYSTYDGNAWSQSRSFDWPSSGCPTSSGKRITYANLWYLGGTLYSYVRSLDTSPHYLVSQDDGQGWELGGRLTSTPQVGYVAGYYKYWGNNTDRIDFFGTEAHPRDNDNSLYHGYVQDGKIHDWFGEVIDDDFTDREAEDVPAYTKVFATGTRSTA